MMGVSGSGKSTVAAQLSVALGASFLDADDFHSAANIAKMSRGEPLDDADRAGWLMVLRQELDGALARGVRVVLACSALKNRYREKLGVGRSDTVLVYLKAPPEVLRARLRERPGHFMKESMLDSQLAALEEPTEAIVVDATVPLSSAIETILSALR